VRLAGMGISALGFLPRDFPRIWRAAEKVVYSGTLRYPASAWRLYN